MKDTYGIWTFTSFADKNPRRKGCFCSSVKYSGNNVYVGPSRSTPSDANTVAKKAFEQCIQIMAAVAALEAELGCHVELPDFNGCGVYCASCGCQAPGDARYCPSCGSAMVHGPSISRNDTSGGGDGGEAG